MKSSVLSYYSTYGWWVWPNTKTSGCSHSRKARPSFVSFPPSHGKDRWRRSSLPVQSRPLMKLHSARTHRHDLDRCATQGGDVAERSYTCRVLRDGTAKNLAGLRRRRAESVHAQPPSAAASSFLNRSDRVFTTDLFARMHLKISKG